MMIDAAQLKRGNVINMDGQLFKIVELSLLTPGNWRSMVQVKIKNLKSGSIVQKRLRSNDKIEVAFLDTRQMEYLYSAGAEHVFMDTETLEQTPIPEDLLDDEELEQIIMILKSLDEHGQIDPEKWEELTGGGDSS
jgi:elongation factor P